MQYLDLKDRLKKHEGMATMKPNPNKVYVGVRAEVAGRKGSVMFVGPAEFAGGGIVVGLRLDEKRTRRSACPSTTALDDHRCKPGRSSKASSDVKKIDEVEDEDDLWDGLAGAAPSESVAREEAPRRRRRGPRGRAR